MKRLKLVTVIFGLMIVLASCSKENDPTPEPPAPTPDPAVVDTKDETLAEKLLGTYESLMTKVVRDGVTKGENLGLYCFVTPSVTQAKDSVTIEVRNWSGEFMPHLLSFKGVVKVEEDKETGKIMMKYPESGGEIPYEVQGIKGVDPEGTVEGYFLLDEKNVPSFNCEFYVFKYTMGIKSVKFKTKTVLPNANSSL